MQIFANRTEIDTMIRDAEAIADPSSEITHTERIDALARSWRSRPEQAASDYFSRERTNAFADDTFLTPAASAGSHARRPSYRTRVREYLQRPLATPALGPHRTSNSRKTSIPSPGWTTTLATPDTTDDCIC